MCELHSQRYFVYPHHNQKLKMMEVGCYMQKMITWLEEEEKYYDHVLSRSKTSLKTLRQEKI